MYKLIFADDESIVRKRIEAMIPWEQEGFVLLGTCANGYELMNLVEKELPDLVILDINMPFISGLDAAKQIADAYPHVKILFLTGYTEFSYAKKALELGALQYIVKPVDGEALLAALRDVKKQLDERKKEIGRIAALENSYRKNGQLLLEELLRGRMEEGRLRERAQAQGILWEEGTWFQAAVLEPDPDERGGWLPEDRPAMAYALCNLTAELLGEAGMACIRDGRVVVVGYGEDSGELNVSMQALLQQVLEVTGGQLLFEATAGISEPVQGCTKAPELVRTARQTLLLRKQHGGGRLFTARDLQETAPGNQIVWDALALIRQAYGDPELSAASVSQRLHISASYLRTLFKAQTGSTIISQITKVRMEKARQLLLEQDLKNSQVAELVGYSDPHYFSYCFRRYYGMNPADYREQHREEK